MELNKENKNKKSPLLIAITAIWFAVIVLKILEFSKIFKIIYFNKDFYYIAPTTKAFVLFFLSVAAEIILLFYIFNAKKRKCVPIIILAIMFLSFNFFSFSSYEYISRDEINLGQSIQYEDVDSVEISIAESPLATGSKGLYTEWLIECKVHSGSSEIILTSSEFLGLEKLNEFIENFDANKVKIDSSNADKLIEFYERKSVFNRNSSEDINLIKQIFKLKT